MWNSWFWQFLSVLLLLLLLLLWRGKFLEVLILLCLPSFLSMFSWVSFCGFCLSRSLFISSKLLNLRALNFSNIFYSFNFSGAIPSFILDIYKLCPFVLIKDRYICFIASFSEYHVLGSVVITCFSVLNFIDFALIFINSFWFFGVHLLLFF